jgi:hypothetical protein
VQVFASFWFLYISRVGTRTGGIISGLFFNNKKLGNLRGGLPNFRAPAKLKDVSQNPVRRSGKRPLFCRKIEGLPQAVLALPV